MQKTAPKSSQYLRNETILKIGKNGHYAKAIAFAKWSAWVKIKIAKSIRKKALEAHYTCLMQKTAPKNS